MPLDYAFTVSERFMRYVRVDTQSDPQSSTHPSTEKQKDLSGILVRELHDIGVSDAVMDDYGYVYATIPANTGKALPVLCFCAHVDTAPDCSGTGVRPLLHRHFDGEDIVLPDDPSQVLRVEDFPYLKEHIGLDIITASGTTLLGGDDKAGVSIIMDLAHYLSLHPEVQHGTIRILFTPDEEVGRGTAKVDLARLGADYGYTLDGGEAGSLEDETFNADAVQIDITGISAHPGYAKGKMVNALKVAGELLAALPKDKLAPEVTDKREGFVHPVRCEGMAEKATVEFIVRDFTVEGLKDHERTLYELARKVVSAHPGAELSFDVTEQYRNMKNILEQHPKVTLYAQEAIRRTGLKVRAESIRGGTDGSRLSYMGLPCPNLFTGMQGIHSRREWIGVSDMEAAVETLVHLVQVWAEHSEE
ncbi:peptidase T [Dinghuibacter silviterrae]|uniref:Peptidase T n=1 Tax=Dinghuibacter silviterrae TaxID=1539049 RepID=A0A4R8DE16_9BACT|nr:peptidase T [Dinghuibacter silviterrae]TDW95753.1 tripeptide aminopeptidase [Dinghuibacter silviterrae]